MRVNLMRLVAASAFALGVTGHDYGPARVLAQGPTFRSAVDLVAVEVQVVDGRGNPVPSLAPDRFEVSIDGKRRRVVSADFLRTALGAATTSAPAAGSPAIAPGPSFPGRTIVVAVDTSSFDIGSIRSVADSAGRFIASLAPEDRVGLYAYPDGVRVDPTTDRASVRVQLSRLIGRREVQQGRYNLKPSEIIDITAEPTLSSAVGGGGGRGVQETMGPGGNAITAVQERECPGEQDCPSRIVSEANHVALQLEGEAARSLNGLRSVLNILSTMPGRKSVVLISTGVLSTDRPGGKPDLSHLSQLLGQTAAGANARVYTIQIEGGIEGLYSSATRGSGGESRRDRDLRGVWLDEFSGLAGGTLIRSPDGMDDMAFDRIRREMSAYYILGVEPAADDRDGRTRSLTVKVRDRGLSVRSRQWVTIPIKQTQF